MAALGPNQFKYLQKDSLNLVNLGERYLSAFPALGYYCLLYVAKKLNNEGKAKQAAGQQNPGIDSDLNLLVSRLEQVKTAKGPFNNANDEMKLQIQMFLDEMLINTDTSYLNGMFTQETIQNFMLYTALLEVMNVFGELSEDNLSKSSNRLT